jgi:single-stranded-DNA-specific exonuclease
LQRSYGASFQDCGLKYRWQLTPAQPLLTSRISAELKEPELLAQCLLNRNLTELEDIRAFLDPRLKRLADPFLLPDMDKAVDRLLQSREKREPVVVFGDYDVDGVCSTAILLEVLGRLGWEVHHFLPHRMDDGYGLSRAAVEKCVARFPFRLLFAVDCGSTSFETVAWLRSQGVDVVILDHHQVSNPIPQAVALVNPQVQAQSRNPPDGSAEPTRDGSPPSPPPTGERAGLPTEVLLTKVGERGPISSQSRLASTQKASHANDVPFSELCSAGLAFKFCHALIKRGREIGLPGASDYDLRPLLDLAALATVADLVPLTGENRILVSAGLERLSQTGRPGLIALKEVSRTADLVGTYEAAFQLSPRLNAAGRLEAAEESLRLLRAQDLSEARRIAVALDFQNRERQRIEKAIAAEVIKNLEATFNPAEHFVIVQGHPSWHIGVVGIVASRVLQKYYRPTIILGGDGAEWRGSGRSIQGFDLAAALRECADLLLRNGGHAMAAGLSLQPANLEPFRMRLNEVARRCLRLEDLQAPLRLDAEVRLEDIGLGLLQSLNRLGPTGQSNPPVHLVARNLVHAKPLRRIGPERQHVKMWVSDSLSTCEAVWWRGGEESLPVGTFDLAFVPQINSYDGKVSVQLKVLDWQPAGTL